MATNISFDDLMPSKQTSAPAKGADISFDDLISKPVSAPATSAEVPTAPRLNVPPPKENETSVLGTIATRYPEAAAAAYGGIKLAGAVGSRIPALPGKLAIVKPAAMVATGLIGSIATAMGINSLEEQVDKMFGTDIMGLKRKQEEERPGLVFGTQLVGGGFNPWMRPGLPSSVAEGALGAGLMTGIGIGTRATQGQDIFDPKSMAADVVSGAFTKPTARGYSALGQTPPVSTPKTPDFTKPLDEQTIPLKEEVVTPEQRAGFVKKVSEEVAKDKAAADAKIPLVQSALRNKDTGEIELLGPKSPEARKAETKDTFEQGFVDEAGTFLNRKEAWNRAKSAGQIPEGQALSSVKDGLRSDDLRIAGDERFKLADVPTEANGVPIKEGTTGRSRPDGRPIGAGFNKETKTITIDTPTLYEQYGEKPWTKPKVEGVYPIAKDAFPTFQDYVDFIVAHEAEHAVTPQAEGQTKAQYENQINQTALKQLADKGQLGVKETGSMQDVLDGKALKDSIYGFDLTGAEKFKRLGDLHTATIMQMGYKPRGEYQIGAKNQEMLQEQARKILKQQEELIDTYKSNSLGQLISETNKALKPKLVVDNLTPSKVVPKETVPTFKSIKDSLNTTSETVPLEQKVDRTTTDPRNVKDEQEMFDIAKEIYATRGEAEAIKFYEEYRNYEKTWSEPIKETEKFVGANLRAKDANERIIQSHREEIIKDIPDPVRREAVAEAIDKGDLTGLTPEEVVVAKRYEALVKDIGDRAVKQGVVKGLLEDYVTHILDWTGAPKGLREEFINKLLGTSKRDPTMRGMDTTSKFAKERKFKTFADLQVFIDEANARIAAAGKSEWRLNIKTKDIAEIYKEYALSMEKAIENKNLVENLKQIRNVEGETLIKEVDRDNPPPPGWSMMDSPQFAGYAVHPDLKPALKFVFDAGPGQIMNALGQLSGAIKRLNVIGSFFHAKSLMEVLSSTQIPIYTPLKEAIVLPLVEKGVKAVTGKDIQLSAISKAVEQFKNGKLGDDTDKWIREDGLILEMKEDIYRGILTSIGKFSDQLIGKFGPKTHILEKSLSTVEKYTLGYFDQYTWNYLHTGGKLMVANAYLEKARRQATELGRPFDESAARKEIARFVNDSFGGLNWFDAATSAQTELGKRMAMAAYSPEGRRALQVLLFAPDWTLSTVRAFTSALPKQLNPTKWQPIEGIKGMMVPRTKQDYARLYQFKTALTYLTLINGINMITADRPVWENKDPTRVEYPDGTSMQAMKHAMEPYHWLADPLKTLSNKLGFIPKAVIITTGGVEYASPTAPKLDPAIVTGNETADASYARGKAILSQALPFQAQAALDAPEGEGAKRALLGTLGFPVYGGTPEQRKAARKERQELRKEKAKRYREREKEAGR